MAWCIVRCKYPLASLDPIADHWHVRSFIFDRKAGCACHARIRFLFLPLSRSPFSIRFHWPDSQSSSMAATSPKSPRTISTFGWTSKSSATRSETLSPEPPEKTSICCEPNSTTACHTRVARPLPTKPAASAASALSSRPFSACPCTRPAKAVSSTEAATIRAIPSSSRSASTSCSGSTSPLSPPSIKSSMAVVARQRSLAHHRGGPSRRDRCLARSRTSKHLRPGIVGSRRQQIVRYRSLFHPSNPVRQRALITPPREDPTLGATLSTTTAGEGRAAQLPPRVLTDIFTPSVAPGKDVWFRTLRRDWQRTFNRWNQLQRTARQGPTEQLPPISFRSGRGTERAANRCVHQDDRCPRRPALHPLRASEPARFIGTLTTTHYRYHLMKEESSYPQVSTKSDRLQSQASARMPSYRPRAPLPVHRRFAVATRAGRIPYMASAIGPAVAATVPASPPSDTALRIGSRCDRCRYDRARRLSSTPVPIGLGTFRGDAGEELASRTATHEPFADLAQALRVRNALQSQRKALRRLRPETRCRHAAQQGPLMGETLFQAQLETPARDLARDLV